MTGTTTSPNAFLAIFWGGLACGILDISQAMIAYNLQSGAKPIQVLQSVASGLLGRESFRGGMKTAALGAALHFLIAFTAATVYYVASRKISFLTTHAVVAGMLYGEMVWLFMTFVVIPLSAIGHPTFSKAGIITGPIGHVFLVGLPIALAVKKYAS